MADEIKYLGQLAVEQLVTEIKAADAKALQAAKDYADSLADNYDAAGTAATKVQELADGQVKTNTEAIAAINDAENGLLKQAKDYADSKVDGVDLSGIAANAEAIEGLEASLAGKADKATTLAGYGIEDALTKEEVEEMFAGASETMHGVAAGLQSAIDGINNADTGILKQAKDYADGKVAAVQGEVDALETLVGTLPEDTTATSVVEYVNAKTSGIASSDNLDALGERVTQAEADIDAIEADYLKAADKTELSNAIGAEKSRAEGIEAGLRSDVDVIKGDYLKTADKTELSNAIAAEKERAEGVEAGLQTQINTIMNNPDTEGVINSINEFTQYISDHGEVAEGFRTDIDANKKAVEDLAAYVGTIPGDVVDVVSEIELNPNGDGNPNFSIAVNENFVEGTNYQVEWDGELREYSWYSADTILIEGTSMYNCTAIVSDYRDGTGHVTVGNADFNVPHTLHVYRAGSNADTVVGYVDEKAAGLETAVENVTEYINQKTGDLSETIGSIEWQVSENTRNISDVWDNIGTLRSGIEANTQAIEDLKAVTHTEITAAEITAMFAS